MNDYREQVKLEFETASSGRAWFRPEYHIDCDLEEWFIYDDFTTDMCWTCWFEAWKKYKIIP